MIKKFLFAITFISIATVIGIAGYLFFAKQRPALAQTAGKIYYVKNGAYQPNWQNCQDINTPCSYIQANQNAVAGDSIVYLNNGGDFTDSIIINPVNNGTAGNPIIFKGQDGATIVLDSKTWSVQLHGKSYINIENFTFRNTTGAMWIRMRNKTAGTPASHHITIRNNIFESKHHYWAGIYLDGDNHHVSILNNVINGGVGSESGHDDLIYFVPTVGYSIDHVLIEGNDIKGGSHNALDIQTGGGMVEYIVIRNNKIHNPNHTSLNIYGEGLAGSDSNLIENNDIYDAGSICSLNSCNENVWGSTGDKSAIKSNHPNFQLYGDYNIIRNNRIYNGGSGLMMDRYNYGNRVYNNVFYKNTRGVYLNSSYNIDRNIFINNAFMNNDLSSPEVNYPVEIDSLPNSPCTNEWAYNNFDETNNIFYHDCNYIYGQKTLGYLETNIPLIFHNGNKYSSVFTNESAYDFHLQGDSPLINAGGFLTKTNGAGNNSNIITVNDARYFTDGWGLIVGDSIQLEGQTAPVIITNVNYNTNTITVNQNISWNDARGVSLVYKGSAPDIGAYEYIQTSPPLKGDFNSDSKVNNLDFTSFKNAFKSIFNSIFDLNSDSTIDVKDLGVLMSGWLP